ncbi:hypothetical protein C9374_008214 [Naegleria lovaniensis]|uniref:Uncharacterized protein n=1 Tax=Naegleria lovaniensis TaxID=51637 RepID=A0AA88GKT3_NAELO|nr:uncharacterized protein C9374_008214 [Naegleria lovaniensis]KAG2378575.1 hypothetical protein C9374_008214 [Naegleria lovaniensis]
MKLASTEYTTPESLDSANLAEKTSQPPTAPTFQDSNPSIPQITTDVAVSDPSRVNSNPSIPNDQPQVKTHLFALLEKISSFFHVVKEVYSTRKKTIWFFHIISLIAFLFGCLIIFAQLEHSFDWLRYSVYMTMFPFKTTGFGIYSGVPTFNYPQFKIATPLWNSVKNPSMNFVFDFSLHTDHLKLNKEKGLQQQLPPMKWFQLSFESNGNCFADHTILIQQGDPNYYFRVSNSDLNVNLNVQVPFRSGNYECSNFQTPLSLKFSIILADASTENRISYEYITTFWANEFMGSFSDVNQFGWKPVRVAMIGNTASGKSTFVNELGDFTTVSNRIKLVSDVSQTKQKDHSTRMVQRYRLWEPGKHSLIPLPLEVQDPPGHDAGVMDRVPMYLEYLVKFKIPPGVDIVTDCSVNPYTCLKNFENNYEEHAEVIIYMIPFDLIERMKDRIATNLKLFHLLHIPVILVVTCGEETNQKIIQDEIEKLDGHSYHAVVISREHYTNNAPLSEEVQRRVGQILLHVFHIVKSRRGAFKTWTVIVRRVLLEVVSKHFVYVAILLMVNVSVFWILSRKIRREHNSQKIKTE